MKKAKTTFTKKSIHPSHGMDWEERLKELASYTTPKQADFVTITCHVLNVISKWGGGCPLVQFCEVDTVFGPIPCSGLNLNPGDKITITVNKADA